jgi:hypothetical protein
VLTALAALPRHLFIDEALASRAYEDTALPIGNGQTISQPWVVARMTEALIEHGMPKKVLEIGTGSGYQAAVLATLGMEVYTVERIDELLRLARRRFRNMGLNLRTKHDDGAWAGPSTRPSTPSWSPPRAPRSTTPAGAAGRGRHAGRAGRARRTPPRPCCALRKTPRRRAARKPRCGGVRAAASWHELKAENEDLPADGTTSAHLGRAQAGALAAGLAQLLRGDLLPGAAGMHAAADVHRQAEARLLLRRRQPGRLGRRHVHRLCDRLLGDGRGVALLDKLGYGEEFAARARGSRRGGGSRSLLAAGDRRFTPVPFKIFTIASGAVGMPLLPFFFGALIGRGKRVFLVALSIRLAARRPKPSCASTSSRSAGSRWRCWSAAIGLAVVRGAPA